MKTRLTPLLLLGLTISLACGESRSERLKREAAYEAGEKKEARELAPPVPPHPTRDKLAPVLNAIYSQDKLPDVLEAEIESDADYELTPGVMAVVRLKQGLSADKQIRAIVTAVAEADAWAYRSKSRRPYAEQVHKVMRGYGDDQKLLILAAYADLKLLDFFNSEGADAAIGQLPADAQSVVKAMKQEFVGDKEAVWNRWMNVKMYARRVVAGDEPFRSVLRTIKKEMGMEEPPPRTWDDSMTGPFKAWAKMLKSDEDLMAKVTNLRELKEREQFVNDTHMLFVVEGAAEVPDKAKKLRPDKAKGFAVLREDLGGGYNDLTFVFSKKVTGEKLKYAYIQAIIFGSLLSDFGLLATAGSDFAKRDDDNRLDMATAVVPDKYDPLYAQCGSEAALDTFITHYKHKFPILQGMKPRSADAKILEKAHECVIEGARGDIHLPDPDDDKDVEGPAPGSRLGLYQMLARYESVDVNMAKMAAEERTEEDEVIDDAEAILKRIKDEKNAGKGIK